MTRSDRQGLDFITDCILGKGFSPSFDEIGAHMGFSSRAAVSHLVHRLVEQGEITIKKGRSRSIELVKKVEKDVLDILTDDVKDLLNAVVVVRKVGRYDFINEAVRDACLRCLPIHRRPDPLAPTTSRAPTSPELAGSSIR